MKRLSFHLPGEQCVTFNDDEDLEGVVEKCSTKDTQFLAWMNANKLYPEGRSLTYAEYPSMFVYKKDKQVWEPRKRGFSLGRLQYIALGMGEVYYMRILLTKQRGCDSFASLRTVKGVVYPTFQDACDAMGLMEDEREYVDGIIHMSEIGSGSYLRHLFVTLLSTNAIGKPREVWDKTWRFLADGILYHRRRLLKMPGIFVVCSYFIYLITFFYFCMFFEIGILEGIISFAISKKQPLYN